MTMALTAGGIRTGGMTAEERKVIFASSLGTVFEWYDFYIYGTLGAFLAKYFFSNVPPNVGFIFALLAFAAGFAVRPFGALIFGRLGDLVGRKYTFLITMTLMGIGTFFIGLLPGYASWGIAAPVVLIGLRLVQGLALGGEYGGAAIYVAEHAPANKRGYYTSWIQTTATLGLFLALLLILGIALLFFGPKRLPELGKGLGSSIRDFRDAMSGPKPDDKASAQIDAPKATVAATIRAEPPRNAVIASCRSRAESPA